MKQNTLDEIKIRAIQETDLPAYKALRLEALRLHPKAFGSDYSEQVDAPDSTWMGRIRSSMEGKASRIILAEAAGELAGMVVVYRDDGVKTRHSAHLVSVYVRPAWRGRRLAEGMIHEVLAWCAAVEVRILRLTVVTSNVLAIRCYQRCGFHVCGVQPEVIHVGDVYHDELLMWRRVLFPRKLPEPI
jgi:ribosomal protein S18 acetylase RimI-like enzyme